MKTGLWKENDIVWKSSTSTYHPKLSTGKSSSWAELCKTNERGMKIKINSSMILSLKAEYWPRLGVVRKTEIWRRKKIRWKSSTSTSHSEHWKKLGPGSNENQNQQFYRKIIPSPECWGQLGSSLNENENKKLYKWSFHAKQCSTRLEELRTTGLCQRSVPFVGLVPSFPWESIYKFLGIIWWIYIFPLVHL